MQKPFVWHRVYQEKILRKWNLHLFISPTKCHRSKKNLIIPPLSIPIDDLKWNFMNYIL